jgi:hypothetical protein
MGPIVDHVDLDRPPLSLLVRGAGLMEWVVALALVGLLASGGLRGLGLLRDEWGVIGARDAVAGLVREARAQAVARGGARITLATTPASALVEAGGTTLRRVDLSEAFGVILDLGGPAQVDLVFDAAGVGRMAARTVRIRRGPAARTLRVSAYGRVR